MELILKCDGCKTKYATDHYEYDERWCLCDNCRHKQLMQTAELCI